MILNVKLEFMLFRVVIALVLTWPVTLWRKDGCSPGLFWQGTLSQKNPARELWTSTNRHKYIYLQISVTCISKHQHKYLHISHLSNSNWPVLAFSHPALVTFATWTEPNVLPFHIFFTASKYNQLQKENIVHHHKGIDDLNLFFHSFFHLPSTSIGLLIIDQ